MTALDVQQTLESLAFLGYIQPPEENQLSAVFGKNLSKNRRRLICLLNKYYALLRNGIKL